MEQVREISRSWTAGTIALRVAALSMVWLVLAEGGVSYWGLIALAVGVSALASLFLAPSSGLGWSPEGWLRFIPFFIGQSVIGGTDVALRALSIRPSIDPTFVEFQFRLTEEPARVVVANAMSLMPGTLSVELDGSRLHMHVLDRSISAVETAREVEEHVARMFRLRFPE